MELSLREELGTERKMGSTKHDLGGDIRFTCVKYLNNKVVSTAVKGLRLFRT